MTAPKSPADRVVEAAVKWFKAIARVHMPPDGFSIEPWPMERVPDHMKLAKAVSAYLAEREKGKKEKDQCRECGHKGEYHRLTCPVYLELAGRKAKPKKGR